MSRSECVGARRNFRVVVPTRDSAGWIAAFAEVYRTLGVRPIYLYDTRSADGTRAILADIAADVVPVEPKHDRVEAMLAVSRHAVETDWVVRLDDDELPSRALIDWLDSSLPAIEEPSLAVSRRDAQFSGGRLCFSRLEDYYFHPQDPTYLNPQWRVFRPHDVCFSESIHTAGFDRPSLRTVPDWAFFVHFDWILRSFEQRRTKLARYERQSAGAGWKYAHFYLMELHAPGDLRWTPFETAEFDHFARGLARVTAAGRSRAAAAGP